MKIKLLINTPDLSVGGNSPKKSVDLKSDDYKGKSIKQVVSKHIFSDILQGQDESIAAQAIELLFNFVQPKNVTDVDNWWSQPFESLIADDFKEVNLDLEFSQEGIAFMEQMM
ncbi:MAG: hypothetical protein HZR80_10815 [Candidatus Heimdallarchaeota archaeon]